MKIWQRILLVALTATIPMAFITIGVITTSINKDVDFVSLEQTGNDFQKLLEQFLELLPHHEALARKAIAGEADARNQLTELQQLIDQKFSALEAVYKESGAKLKFTDEELAACKSQNASLKAVEKDWKNLKSAPLVAAAADDQTEQAVIDIRAMITYAGNKSNLILDTDLDSYYLIDSSLSALPQTQERLGTLTFKTADWLRSGAPASNRTDIAITLFSDIQPGSES